jgi:hypothetical protein
MLSVAAILVNVYYWLWRLMLVMLSGNNVEVVMLVIGG